MHKGPRAFAEQFHREAVQLHSWPLFSTPLSVQLSSHHSFSSLQPSMQNVWIQYRIFGPSTRNTGDAAPLVKWGHFGRNGALRLWKQHLQAKHWQSSFYLMTCFLPEILAPCAMICNQLITQSVVTLQERHCAPSLINPPATKTGIICSKPPSRGTQNEKVV